MSIKFKIESIFESDFYLKHIPSVLKEEIDVSLLSYDIHFEIKIDEGNNILVGYLNVKSKYPDIDFLKTKVWPNSNDISDEDLQTLMNLTLIVTFNVDPLTSLITKVKTGKELDISLLTLVSEVVLSTARGIIHARSQGSIVGGNPLPYINSASFNAGVKDL